MSFFQKIKNSIYSPEFYSQVPKQSFSSALSYFVLLALVFAVLRSILPIWQFSTVGQKQIDMFVANAQNLYPKDLEVKIQNGKLSTNVKEPYTIPMSDNSGSVSDNTNLVVIDTKTPFSAAKFDDYHTVAWVGKDAIFVRGDRGSQLRTIDLSNAKDMTLNKTTIDAFVQRASPFIKLIVPIVVVFIILGTFIVNLFTLLGLLIVAVLIWLLFKLINKPLSYGGSYKVGMYALTLGFFVDTVKEWFYYPGFPFLHTFLTLIVVLINFSQLSTAKAKKKK